jgi:ERCC4-type nuclease
VQAIDINWISVDLTQEFLEIKKYLDLCFKSKLIELREKKYLQNYQNISKKDLLLLQGSLMAEISKGERDFDAMKAVSITAEALKVYHAIELIETQGISPLLDYMEKLNEESITTKTQATKNLVKDMNFKSALIKTRTAFEKNIEHPKLTKLKEILIKESSKDKKIIVFSNYRDTASQLVDEINKIENLKATLFIGQAKRNENGLTQKQQKQIIEDFKENKFNCLVATSVAEEGLDIPQVDYVIFFEPVPSAIRHIQRRGRTGRQEKGRVSVLMAKNTRDEHYRWSSFHKERKMKSHIEDLKKRIILSKNKIQQNKIISDFIEEKEIKIFVDYREKGSLVLKELIDLEVKLNLEQLSIGDFVLSSRVAIEYKTVPDFVDSIIDGRLLEQLKVLKRNFERPLIILEGEQDIYALRKIHPNAINGMLATIAVSYGIPILKTKNQKETANLIYIIAKREQEESDSSYSMHEKKPLTEKEMQEYIVSAFPGIGLSLAKPLLKKFKSIKNIINSDINELKEVEKIGEKKAKAIKDIVEKEYEE